MHLLVVDDEPAVAVVIEHAARRWGYRVTTARSLAEGREAVAGPDRFDAILVDLGLPDGNGLTLVHTIRDTPERAGVPVIVLTGAGDDHVLTEAAALGADVVTKPFSPTKLRLLLDDRMQRPSASP